MFLTRFSLVFYLGLSWLKPQGRLTRFNCSGDSIYYTSTVSAALNKPAGICISPTGVLYIADHGSNTIKAISSTGCYLLWQALDHLPLKTVRLCLQKNFCFQVGLIAGNNSSLGVAVDLNGNVLVADTYNNDIIFINVTSNLASTLAGTVGTAGSADGQGIAATFNRPFAVFVGVDGSF